MDSIFQGETDSQTLVWILNQPLNNLPNAMMTRWLSYIRLFDFDARHVPRNKNGAVNGLSRHGGKGDYNEVEEDPDELFEAKLGNNVVKKKGMMIWVLLGCI
jgi:hypothetical protein